MGRGGLLLVRAPIRGWDSNDVSWWPRCPDNALLYLGSLREQEPIRDAEGVGKGVDRFQRRVLASVQDAADVRLGDSVPASLGISSEGVLVISLQVHFLAQPADEHPLQIGAASFKYLFYR